MKNNTKIIKEAAISFSGMGFGQILRYLFTTILARWIGIELLGIYSISNAISRIFEVIGKCGLDYGILRAASRENEQHIKKYLILSALKMGLISGMIIMIVQIFIADWLSSTIFHQSSLLTMVIITHAISIPLYILIQIAAFSTQSYKILKYKIFVNEIQNPLILLLSMVILFFAFSAESAIMFSVILTSIFGMITISIFLKKVTSVNIFSIKDGKYNADLISYSVPIMFMSILGAILHWTDIFMLGYFTDPYVVGLYHPAARTAGIIRMILLAFAGIYGPIMAGIYVKKQINEMIHVFKLVTRWITTFSIPFAILIFMYPKKVMLIFGENYIDGYQILIILALAAFIQAIFGIGGTTLNMTGFPKMNLLNTFIGCSLNICLNIILIPNMGGLGAALATLCTLTLIAFIRGIQNWKLLQLTPWSWKLIKPFAAGIITLAIGHNLKAYIMSLHTIHTLICAGFVIFILFFTLLWLFGLDEDDLELQSGLSMIFIHIKSLLRMN